MMADEKTGVFRIDYEMNNSTWVAHIAGKSTEDALNTLMGTLKGNVVKVGSMGFESRLDAISTTITKEITRPFEDKINKLQKDKEALMADKPAKKKPGRKPKDESIKIGKQ